MVCMRNRQSKPIEFYLERIKNLDYVELKEDFNGQDTKVSYRYPICGCTKETTLKLLSKFKNVDVCFDCLRKRKGIEKYLSKIPISVEIIGDINGNKTIGRIYHNKCNHSIELTLSSLIKKSNFDFCNSCLRAKLWLDKIPSNVRNNVSIIGDNISGNSFVDLKYDCGHSRKLKLSDISQLKKFDKCPSCYLDDSANKYLKKIPKEYRKNIEFITKNGYESKVIYKNTCGHDSYTTISCLSQRDQFDNCSVCVNKKTFKDFKLPEDLNVSLIHEDGRQSIVRYKCKKCGKYSNVKLSSLLSNGGNGCKKCPIYNKLTNDDVIYKLSDYMIIDKIEGLDLGNRKVRVYGRCKNCGSQFDQLYFNLLRYFEYYKKPRCPKCNPKNIVQSELFLFVKSICSEVEENKRIIKFNQSDSYCKELDIWCPLNKFAIEFNGLFWHSEKYINDKYYHYNKTKFCIDNDISLLHIWSDRYYDKPEIYHSIIKVKLGLIENKIHARKTIIKELSKKDIKVFFDNNHIDGNVGCITGWGLFYDDKLIQVISVRKVSHQNKKYKGYLEVARSATLINHLVVGGESKLLNMVERYARDNSYYGILNYVSFDFGGLPKKKWKFTFQGKTGVSYFYTDGSRRVSRQYLQQRSKNKTEKQYAKELNLLKVWGTPNLVYAIKF